MSHCSYCACVHVCMSVSVCDTSFSVQVGSVLIKFTPMTKGANQRLCDARSLQLQRKSN